MTTAAGNLVEQAHAALRPLADAAELSVVPLEKPGTSDVAIVVRRGPAGTAVEAERLLAEAPAVRAVRRAQQRLLVTFEDDAVAAAGAALEAGERGALDCTDLLAGERWVVDFCDPNTTKSLHVGHLRNLAIGSALAGLLEAAGARVERQSQIADAGHQIGEAMAGLLRYGEGRTPQSTGEKSDQFVGRCYAAYAAERRSASETEHAADLPVAREMNTTDDLATELMRRWENGEPEAVELWRRIRDWVVDGQRATLARLGIAFERELFESDTFGRIAGFVQRALALGILTRTDDGAVVYATGDEDYPLFPLARADGFPNQNLRALDTYFDLTLELQDATMVQVCGAEWRAHHLYIDQIIRRLRPDLAPRPSHCVFYEMVTDRTGVVSSSSGGALLVDRLLDQLAADAGLRALAGDGRAPCEPERLAVMTALGFCLGVRTNRPTSLTAATALEPRTSVGWAFAHAWATAWSPDCDGAPDPAPDDPGYRFAVVQAQLYREHVRRALAALDLTPLVQFLWRLSRWHAAADAGEGAARAMRTLLRAGFCDLGLCDRAGTGARPVPYPASVAASITKR